MKNIKEIAEKSIKEGKKAFLYQCGDFELILLKEAGEELDLVKLLYKLNLDQVKKISQLRACTPTEITSIPEQVADLRVLCNPDMSIFETSLKEVVTEAFFNGSYFSDIKDMQKFLCQNFPQVDLGNVGKRELYEFDKESFELKREFPEFDLKKPESWDAYGEVPLNLIKQIIEEWICSQSLVINIVLMNESLKKRNNQVINEAATDEDIKNLINGLDGDSILLLNGLITSDYTKKYSPEMKKVVADHIIKNRTKTSAGKIVLGSYFKESKEVSGGELIDSMSNNDLKRFTYSESKIMLYENLSNEIVAIKIGKNKVELKTISK